MKILPFFPKFLPKMCFWGFFGDFLGNFWGKEGFVLRSKNFKGGRCVKKKLKKSEIVIRTYDKIQTVYADILDKDENVSEIRCNVVLEDLEDGEYTSDFLCVKKDGDYMVRECVFRKKLSLPRTCKLLDASREYWTRRGITDWGIVVEKEEQSNAGK